VVLPYSINDTVVVPSSMVVGENDAAVGITVFNPTIQVGATYDIWYGGSGTTRTYTIVRTIAGSTDYATVTALMVPAKTDTLAKKSKGSASFTINDAKNQVTYPKMDISSLTGSITGAEIRIGNAATVNGTVVHTFAVTNNEIVPGTWSIPDSLVDEFIGGNLYVNVLSALRPTGEIRGQIANGLFVRDTISNPPVGTLPTITTYEASWVPNEGVAFYVSPAPTGAKSVKQTAPTEGDIVKTPPTNDVKSPDGSYSVTRTDLCMGRKSNGSIV
jgi:hypothetical protein